VLSTLVALLALVAGLLVPGWCLLSTLNLKGVSPLLALPAAAGISLSIVSVAAWLGWLTGTGMIGAAVLTALASVAAVAARIVWRTRSSPLPRPQAGDHLFEIGAAALALFSAGISVFNGPWLGQSADTFYHMAAALRLLQENRAIPQDVFFGVNMQYPDATSGTLHVALAWLSLIGGIVPAWVAVSIFGSAFLALSFATFARELTRSTPAALIAAYLYFVASLYFDMRDMGYPDRIGQSLGWLSLVFLLRYTRSSALFANAPHSTPAPAAAWRDNWHELVPMCLLAFTAGSVYPGMSPLLVILAMATFGFAALVALKRRNLYPLMPIAIACGAMLLVVLPVLAVRLLAALPAPGIEANLSTYSARLRVIVFHGYPFIDPRTWFGGTLITIGTVGTICLLGRARRLLLEGDAGAALLWGGVLFVPAVMATPLVTGSSTEIYALARIGFLLSPLLFLPIAWELTALTGLPARIRSRISMPRVAAAVVAGLLLVAATTNLVAARLVSGTLPIYFGHGPRSISTTHRLDLTRIWAGRLEALQAAGPGTVLADLETSYELAGLTGRTVVAVPRGHTPYQYEALDAAMRRGDVSDALRPAADPGDLLSVLVRYHVTFVMADQVRDGQASWKWIERQKELTTVASGKGWKLYRFDPSLIDEALAIPINGGARGGVAFFPTRVIAGRAVFVRIASAGQSGVARVFIAGTSATYEADIAVPAPAGATVTVPIVLPDSAPVDSYQINVMVPGANPFKGGRVDVGHAYEAEYFVGVYQNYRRGFARDAGWEVLNNVVYHRAQAAAALLVGSVARHPLYEPPGNYCLSLSVYDAGDGKPHSISVGLGGNAVGTTWSGAVKGVRDLELAASVGTASHELTYWVPAGARPGTVIDRITLYPDSPDGTCGTAP
jgi:hypothetical protein